MGLGKYDVQPAVEAGESHVSHHLEEVVSRLIPVQFVMGPGRSDAIFVAGEEKSE